MRQPEPSHEPPPHRPIHGLDPFRRELDINKFPETGMPARAALDLIETGLMLDGRETLNLASFVTT